MSRQAIWHDVECGGYAADLAVWERLGDAAEGPVLELGCGTGRVALHLARRGHQVWGVDADMPLVEALRTRSAAGGLGVRAACGDVLALGLGLDFGLIIAPMQLFQMLGGKVARRAALDGTAVHLTRGGLLAAAIVEGAAASLDGVAAALPDVRELDGWVYSSTPVAVARTDGGVEIRRLRQAASPDGTLSEEEHLDSLDALDASDLEAEAAAAGLRPAQRLEVPPVDGYLGSTVVVMERP